MSRADFVCVCVCSAFQTMSRHNHMLNVNSIQYPIDFFLPSHYIHMQTISCSIHFNMLLANRCKCSIVNFNFSPHASLRHSFFECIWPFPFQFYKNKNIFHKTWYKPNANVACYWHHADNTVSFVIQTHRYTCHIGERVVWKTYSGLFFSPCSAFNATHFFYSRFEKVFEKKNSIHNDLKNLISKPIKLCSRWFGCKKLDEITWLVIRLA